MVGPTYASYSLGEQLKRAFARAIIRKAQPGISLYDANHPKLRQVESFCNHLSAYDYVYAAVVQLLIPRFDRFPRLIVTVEPCDILVRKQFVQLGFNQL